MSDMKDRMKPHIIRYLESCAFGIWDGSQKADSHTSLCELYVFYHPEANEDIVHELTRKLTDHLDEEIDFPLNKAPRYNILWHEFYKKFIEYAGGNSNGIRAPRKRFTPRKD